MIDVESINELHVSTVARWHREPIDNPYGDPTASTDCVLPVVCQQHQFNYLLWHEEDIARSPDVSDTQIARVKRNIDKYNQAEMTGSKRSTTGSRSLFKQSMSLSRMVLG